MTAGGFTYGQTDDGAFWLRNPEGRFKRVQPELLAALNAGLASASAEIRPALRRAIETLKREGFVREGEPVVPHPVVEDVSLGLRLAVFFGGFGVLTGCAWLALDTATAVRDPWNHLWALPLFAALAIFHELAHYAAARPYFRPRIGFGLLNGFFPAIVTHTNDAWTCPRGVRIWINLAGPLVDVLVGCTLGLAFVAIWPHHSTVAALVVIQWLRVVFVLNPLLEGDGYWCLCDATGITNLRTRGLRDLREARPSAAAGYALGSVLFTALSLFVVGWFMVRLFVAGDPA